MPEISFPYRGLEQRERSRGLSTVPACYSVSLSYSSWLKVGNQPLNTDANTRELSETAPELIARYCPELIAVSLVKCLNVTVTIFDQARVTNWGDPLVCREWRPVLKAMGAWWLRGTVAAVTGSLTLHFGPSAARRRAD